MIVAFQVTLLLAPLYCMVVFAAAKTILGCRRILCSTGCGGSWGLYLFGGSGGGSQTLLGSGILQLLISFPFLFRGPGGIIIIIVTILGSSTIRLLLRHCCLNFAYFCPIF